MSNPNDTDPKSQSEIKVSPYTSGDESRSPLQGSGRSRSSDGNPWLDSVRAVTKQNLEYAADASTEFARNNPWKMMGICVAAGAAFGVLISLK